MAISLEMIHKFETRSENPVALYLGSTVDEARQRLADNRFLIKDCSVEGVTLTRFSKPRGNLSNFCRVDISAFIGIE
jgi:hypothetical protein